MDPPVHAAALTPSFLFLDLKALRAFALHTVSSHLVHTTLLSTNTNTFFDIYRNIEVIAKIQLLRGVPTLNNLNACPWALYFRPITIQTSPRRTSDSSTEVTGHRISEVVNSLTKGPAISCSRPENIVSVPHAQLAIGNGGRRTPRRRIREK